MLAQLMYMSAHEAPGMSWNMQRGIMGIEVDVVKWNALSHVLNRYDDAWNGQK